MKVLRLSASEKFLSTRTFVLGIGAQKCSTSWLAESLRQHPEIHMFPWKEAHYWDSIGLPHHNRVLEMLDNRIREGRGTLAAKLSIALSVGRPAARNSALHVQRELALNGTPDREGYRRLLMYGYKGQPIVSEYTPAYAMLSREYFDHMRQIHPDTRFIFIMRDPVRRHISSVKHFLARGRGLEIDGETTSDPEFRSLCVALAEDPSSPVYRRGDYRRTIEELEAVVDPAQIFYGFYETLMSDAEMSRLAEFVGVRTIASDSGRWVNGSRLSFDSEGEELTRHLAHCFEGIYAFVRNRFGPQMPSSWYDPAV